jgi:hypothetical protein
MHRDLAVRLPISTAELSEALGLLGLSAAEASIYLYLTQAGPSKASDVAQGVRIRRPEAYRVLQGLVARGFVSASLSRPTRFDAAPAEKLFGQVYGAQEEAWERIARAQPRILEGLAALRVSAIPLSPKGTFRILQGRLEATRAAERMVQEARRGIDLLDLHPRGSSGLLDLPNLADLTARRALDGIATRALLSGPPGETLAAARPRPARLVLRYVPTDRRVRGAVVDGREVLFWMVHDPSKRVGAEGDVAVWSDAPDFVSAQAFLFEHAWRAGKDLEH